MKNCQNLSMNCDKENPLSSTNSIIDEDKSNTQQTLIQPKQLICHLCNVTCNSQQMFDNHIRGRKHQIKTKSKPVCHLLN